MNAVASEGGSADDFISRAIVTYGDLWCDQQTKLHISMVTTIITKILDTVIWTNEHGADLGKGYLQGFVGTEQW
jgi:hypothetical protein